MPEQETHHVHVNRGLVFWGVTLITAGAVALGIQAGILAGETAREAWRFWPVALIAIGLAVIGARTPFALVATLLAALVVGGLAGTLASGFPDGIGVGCGGEAGETIRESGVFGASAVVELDLNCGELSVSTTDGSDWSVVARHASGAEPQISSTDASLRVASDDGGALGFAESRQEWEVVLPAETDLDVAIEANAAESIVDLESASLTRLEIGANAGDVALRLDGASVGDLAIDANAAALRIDGDEATALDGSVSMNAGSLKLCVPETAGIAITIANDNITFSHNLEDRGLTQRGDTWSTAADAAITLDVEGNAASLELNPEDGCS